ncbi:PaaX family transcriptional regulator C-terminal domain-containing protein [Blastococcus montanus]|uniref:PaaX family transcriptional regulator n=1 Tax=Blastococcus montanus TaxID=3144973 RepID=UPI00320A0F4A
MRPDADITGNGPHDGAAARQSGDGLRPQTLLFTFLGRHALDYPGAVSSSILIDVLDELGVSLQAARSTITRMVNRGHLERHRAGRRAYFTISPSLRTVLGEGENRIFRVPVRESGDETWTLLSFSIPENERAVRHSLRVALSWNGFGLLRSGLWIAPGVVDIFATLDRLELRDRVDVFHAQPADPTYLTRVSREVWDLPSIAERYHRFIDAWRSFEPGPDRHLTTRLQLITEWQQTLVDDPELPVRHLPDDWPAVPAYELFLRLHERLSPGAEKEFARLLERGEAGLLLDAMNGDPDDGSALADEPAPGPTGEEAAHPSAPTA